jgi:hypothetical protein
MASARTPGVRRRVSKEGAAERGQEKQDKARRWGGFDQILRAEADGMVA